MFTTSLFDQLKKIVSNEIRLSLASTRIVTKPVPLPKGSKFKVTDRQERVPGWDQSKLSPARILLVGAGGLNGPIAFGLVKMGIGALDICDFDRFEASNATRQFCTAACMGQNKARRLVKNIAPFASGRTELRGYVMSVEDMFVLGVPLERYDLVIYGVDDQETRWKGARMCQEFGLPAIFTAVDLQADSGYVAIQRSHPDAPCFGCFFPTTATESGKIPCQVPSSIEIMNVMAGMVLRAVTTVLMNRPLAWNFRTFRLAGFAESEQFMIEARHDCPLFGQNKIVPFPKPDISVIKKSA